MRLGGEILSNLSGLAQTKKEIYIMTMNETGNAPEVTGAVSAEKNTSKTQIDKIKKALGKIGARGAIALGLIGFLLTSGAGCGNKKVEATPNEGTTTEQEIEKEMTGGELQEHLSDVEKQKQMDKLFEEISWYNDLSIDEFRQLSKEEQVRYLDLEIQSDKLCDRYSREDTPPYLNEKYNPLEASENDTAEEAFLRHCFALQKALDSDTLSLTANYTFKILLASSPYYSDRDIEKRFIYQDAVRLENQGEITGGEIEEMSLIEGSAKKGIWVNPETGEEYLAYQLQYEWPNQLKITGNPHRRTLTLALHEYEYDGKVIKFWAEVSAFTKDFKETSW